MAHGNNSISCRDVKAPGNGRRKKNLRAGSNKCDYVTAFAISYPWLTFADMPEQDHATERRISDPRTTDQLTWAVWALVDEVKRANEWLRSHSDLATKDDLRAMEKRIMDAITNYATSVNAAFDEIDTAVTAAGEQLTGLVDDVAFLKETIDKLQNSPGTLTPEDQALLDAAQARTGGLVTRFGAFKDAITALNAATERPATPS